MFSLSLSLSLSLVPLRLEVVNKFGCIHLVTITTKAYFCLLPYLSDILKSWIDNFWTWKLNTTFEKFRHLLVVLYIFNQNLGVVHSKCWSNYVFSHFSQEFNDQSREFIIFRFNFGKWIEFKLDSMVPLLLNYPRAIILAIMKVFWWF